MTREDPRLARTQVKQTRRDRCSRSVSPEALTNLLTIMRKFGNHRAQKKPPRTKDLVLGGFMERIPAITDFRAKGTIMGLAGLTAVFGMGTGVTPPVWSPEMYPAGGQARPGTGFPRLVAHEAHKP